MAKIIFLPRSKAELMSLNHSPDRAVFDVSSYAPSPFKRLSPLAHSRDYRIPVPGTDAVSNSVEGIWQGLKVIDGVTDENLFIGKPKKRRGKVSGHSYDGSLLDVMQARVKIYYPAYKFYLENYAPEQALDEILKEQRSGKMVYLHDVEENGDLRDPRPMAHSAFLAFYLNARIASEPKRDTAADVTLSEIIERDAEFTDKVLMIHELAEQDDMFRSVVYRCIDHPTSREDWRIGKALQHLRKI